MHITKKLKNATNVLKLRVQKKKIIIFPYHMCYLQSFEFAYSEH